ncbi:MAG: hypothetical protein HOY71_29985, partial [Nonomuraea sp.]|nr:hypothetical protein [Nonomuraea sp.]
MVLIPTGIGGVVVARSIVAGSIWKETRDAAAHVTSEIRANDLPTGSIPLTDASVDLIQVVEPGGTVIASSDAAHNLPPLSRIWPTADE